MGTRNYDHMIKLLIIGDQAVGKTCILLKLSDSTFTTTHIATIGVDFKTRMMDIRGTRIKLQVWDTAGQERFKNITRSYYKGAMGVILAYDCTSRESFRHISDWLEQIQLHASQNIVKFLVANKCDLESKRLVSPQQGVELAEQIGVTYFQTSAKTGQNIQEAFRKMAEEIIDRGLIEQMGFERVSVNPQKGNSKSSCC